MFALSAVNGDTSQVAQVIFPHCRDRRRGGVGAGGNLFAFRQLITPVANVAFAFFALRYMGSTGKKGEWAHHGGPRALREGSGLMCGRCTRFAHWTPTTAGHNELCFVPRFFENGEARTSRAGAQFDAGSREGGRGRS